MTPRAWRGLARLALAAGWLALATSLSAAPRVRVGLDQIEAQRGGPLRGRRVGLVVHGASVAADGRHAIDVLRGAGVEVVRLFTPEHGLRGRAAAGEKVPSGVDDQSGLPVVSLYGEKRQPSAEDLAGLDALVVDLRTPVCGSTPTSARSSCAWRPRRRTAWSWWCWTGPIRWAASAWRGPSGRAGSRARCSARRRVHSCTA